jgi:hypothetical protein
MFGVAFRGVMSAGGATPDTADPTISAASIEDSGVSATVLRLTFNEPMNTGDTVITTDFDVSVDASLIDTSDPTWASSTVLELTTDDVVLVGSTVTVSVDAGAVRDVAGNYIEAAAGLAVTNNSTRTGDVTAPTVASVSIEENGTDGTRLVIVFSEDMDPAFTITPSEFGLDVDGEAVTLTTIGWTDTDTLEFETDREVWSFETNIYLGVDAGAVADLAGNAIGAGMPTAVTNNADFSPFAGAHDGFIADLGVTDVSGYADAITDQSGNGNTLSAPSSTQRPQIIANWRNGKTALLGRTGASTVLLFRTTHANGSLAQPFTRYIVGGWTAGVDDYLVSGPTARADCNAHGATGFPSNFVNGTGAAERQAASEPVSAAPFIWRTVHSGAATASRLEPHGASPITWSGANGNGVFNGIALLGHTAGASFNYAEHIAAEFDISGDLPSADAALDARIMGFLRAYYDIVHS